MNYSKTAANSIRSLDKESVDHHDLGNSRLGISVIMLLAAFIGVWGTTCLISGLANAGSIQEISSGLITALTGI